MTDQLRHTAEEGVRALLQLMGDDPDRDGVVDTPARVVKAYLELAARPGDPAVLLAKQFDVEHTDEMVYQVDTALLKAGRVKEGDFVVIIVGTLPGLPGSTNALRIHRMGDAIKGLSPAYHSSRPAQDGEA